MAFSKLFGILVVAAIGFAALDDAPSLNFSAHKATVVVFLGSECPAVPRIAPRLNELHKQFGKQGVQFIALYPNGSDTAAIVRDHAKRMGFGFECRIDPKGQVAKQLGATKTPEIVIVDAKGRKVYQGAIDSDAKVANPQHRYAERAISAAIDGKSMDPSRTEVVGCFIKAEAAVNGKEVATFVDDIAPIMFEYCTPCHRPGQIGPFPLINYDDAKKWAQEIEHYTQSRTMPPWKPQPGHGDFRGERRLSDAQLASIKQWVEAGCPQGDPSHMPKQPDYPQGWEMGVPDVVAQMSHAYDVAGTGADEYRYFVIPVEAPENSAMIGIDIVPGSREVVHHANVYVDVTGAARKLDEADPGVGYSNFGSPGFLPTMMLGGWVPGMRPMRLHQGYGVVLPRKFDLVLQVHYFKRGQTYRDQTKVGLYLGKASEVKPVQLAVLSDTRFTIPANDPAFKIQRSWTVAKKVELVAIMAHAHLVCKDVKVSAKMPNGEERNLLWIDDYDFNWQETYFYKQPMTLEPGTVVTARGLYDNSEKNKRNPNSPPKPVKYGDKTTDEMFYVFLAVADETAKGSGFIITGL